MKKPALPNLHDAIIVKFSFIENSGRLAIEIRRGANNKVPESYFQLIFSGFINTENILQTDILIGKIMQREQRDNLGYRIDSLSYCDLLVDEKVLKFALCIDHLEVLLIYCRKLSIHNEKKST